MEASLSSLGPRKFAASREKHLLRGFFFSALHENALQKRHFGDASIFGLFPASGHARKRWGEFRLLQARRFGGNGMSPRKKTTRKSGNSQEIIVPDKLYFRIGEVARLCRLPAYVLRFWETEFPQLKPVKSGTGQRMYRQRDAETALRIKKLLYEEGFTIPGARQHLKAEAKPAKAQATLPFAAKSRSEGLKKVRQGLQEILTILSSRR